MQSISEIQSELQALCAASAGPCGVSAGHLTAISQRIVYALENQGRVILLGDENMGAMPDVMAGRIRLISGFPKNAGPLIGVSSGPNERIATYTLGRAGQSNDICLAIADNLKSSEFINSLKTALKKQIAVACFTRSPMEFADLPVKMIALPAGICLDEWAIQLANYLGKLYQLLFPQGAEEIHQMSLGWNAALEESKKISLPRSGNAPEVSIVLPTRNRFDTVKRCIEVIIKNASAPFEIIVMDDSSDGSDKGLQTLFESTPNVFILHGEERRGLLPSVNLGLALSIGEYVVGLTDDVDVYKGWEVAMIRLLENEPECGAATPLILEADGTIQSMGVIDGVRSWKYPELPTVYGAKGWIGRGRTPEQCPETRWVRECDYGCISFMRRQLMNQMGGFDTRYNKYCADTDIGMRLRLNGYKVLYCPQSVMIHHQLSRDVQNKTDDQIKNNQKIFHQKWGVYTVPQ